MANLNTPFGLRPVRLTNGAPWCGEANTYMVAGGNGSAFHIGDVVIHGGTADINGIPTATKYAAGGSGATSPVGVIVGVLPVSVRNTSLVGSALNLEITSIPAAEANDRYILVVDSTDVIFEVQADSTGISRNSVGSNVDLTVTVPSEGFNLSATVLDNATDAATATLPYRIVGLSTRPKNEINATAATDEPFVVAYVRPNEHFFKEGLIGTAV